MDSSKILDAPRFNFLWTEWFGLGFYGAAVIPLLIAYIVSTIETVGDITATHKVSLTEIDSTEYKERIQGGLLSDAICSILASLCTLLPNTTYSQKRCHCNDKVCITPRWICDWDLAGSDGCVCKNLRSHHLDSLHCFR